MGEIQRTVKGKVVGRVTTIPLGEVGSVAVRKFSIGRTFLFVGGATGGIIGLWFLNWEY